MTNSIDKNLIHELKSATLKSRNFSFELQKELPGLRGFSSGNLKKMRVFAEFWMDHIEIGSAMPNQFENAHSLISSTLSNQLPGKHKGVLPDSDTLKKLLD